MPKHVGVELERINNKKPHYFIQHLLVFLHTIHTTLLPCLGTGTHQYNAQYRLGTTDRWVLF
jgi:hypothetical protein